MKRPSFQFYPGDWRKNAKLRRCTEAARGAWMDVLCVLHDADEYGIVRWPLADLARAACVPVKLLRELADKGVLKGADKSAAAYVYAPRHAGKTGNAVTLIPESAGPVWYCSRFVRDEWVRLRRGAGTRFGDEGVTQPQAKAAADTERARLREQVWTKTQGRCYHCSCQLGASWEIDHLVPRSKGGSNLFSNLVPSCVPCNQEKSDTMPDDWSASSRSPTQRIGVIKGDPQGYGPSSSSSATQIPSDADASAGKPALPLTARDVVFALGVPILTAANVKESNARSFLAMQAKAHGDSKVAEALQRCSHERPVEPVSWLQSTLGPIKAGAKAGKHTGFDQLNYHDGVTADGHLE